MSINIFSEFSNELIKWNKSINLIQEKTEKELRERHINNSLELKPFVDYEHDLILDIGSGAGFPGLVLAIDGAKHVQLVEPNGKKTAFLNHIKNLYCLPITIHATRWQDLEAKNFSVVTSRAFAPLTELLEIINFVSRETNQVRGLFLKGEKIQEEIAKAEKKWLFNAEIFPSKTHNTGCIVKIEGVQKK